MRKVIIVVLAVVIMAVMLFNPAGAQKKGVVGNLYSCTYEVNGKSRTTRLCGKSQQGIAAVVMAIMCDWPGTDVKACAKSVVCRPTGKECRWKGWGTPWDWW